MTEEKTYTVKEVSAMLGKNPSDITSKVKAGGIKGIKIQPTDNGVEYLLTDKSINQLGALFGIVPKPLEEVESEKMINIDGKALSEEISKSAYKAAIMSKAVGKADNYLSNCIGRNRISIDAVEKINHIFGFDIRKFEVKKEEKKPELLMLQAEQKSQTMDTEAIRGAVYNGMIDAMLMVLKEDMVKRVLLQVITDSEFADEFQAILFHAMNGVRRKMEQEKEGGAQL